MTSVNTQWMRGPNYLRNVLDNYIQLNLPTYIEAMRDQWSLPDAELPQFNNFNKSDLQYMDNLGSIITIYVSEANAFERVDVDDMIAQQFRVTYSVRVYMWVRAGDKKDGTEDGRTRTFRIRDMLSAAVRAALLAQVSLGTTDCEAKQETMSEVYSDVTPGKGNYWIGGTYWAFDIKVDEGLVVAVPGTADTIITPVQLFSTSGG